MDIIKSSASWVHSWPKPSDAEYAVVERKLILPVGIAAVTGAVSQNFPGVFPQFIRWHLTNLADVPLAASAFAGMNFPFAGKLNRNTAVVAAVAAGLAWEGYESFLPNRSFDYADCGCYVAGAMAYVVVREATARIVARNRVRKLATAMQQ